jgi:hypothetical protein
MNDQPYLNREVDEKFNDIKDALLRIETQTTKTNGRVGKLERWQSSVLGFCACVTTLLIPLVYFVLDRLFF